MTETEQEIKAKADQAVEMFFKIIAASYAENDIAQDIAHIMYDKDATQCAIIMYEDRVKELERLIYKESTFEAVPQRFHDWLNDSFAILTELKSRI